MELENCEGHSIRPASLPFTSGWKGDCSPEKELQVRRPHRETRIQFLSREIELPLPTVLTVEASTIIVSYLSFTEDHVWTNYIRLFVTRYKNTKLITMFIKKYYLIL